MSTTYLIKNAAILGGEPTDLLLEDGVIKEIGTELDRLDGGSASRSSTRPG